MISKKRQLAALILAVLFLSPVFVLAAEGESSTPWAWYISRATALLGFIFLYISIFLGLTIRIPFLRKIFSPVYSVKIHCWISLQALIMAFIHGVSLMFDKYIGFRLEDVFIPFASSYKTDLVALGVFSFYIMLLLVISSYGKKYFSYGFWRTTHFLNIGLYIATLIHALLLGTDMQNELIRNIFIWSNAFLVFLMLINMELRISDNMARKAALRENSVQ